MGRPSTLRVLLWGERPQCRAERKLLFKLDLVILVSPSSMVPPSLAISIACNSLAQFRLRPLCSVAEALARSAGSARSRQTYSCVSFWVNYLDRGALSNAYVTGMKEDLHLHGHQFNVVNTCLTVGCESSWRETAGPRSPLPANTAGDGSFC